MNTIVRMALSGAIKMLVGGTIWAQIKDAVLSVSNAEISGEEKKAMVIASLKSAGIALAGWALNLALEIAVAVLLKASAKLEE